MKMRCSHSPLWQNTVVCVRSRAEFMLLIAENIIQIIFLILSLSVNSCDMRMLALFIQTQLARNTACRNLWRMQVRTNERSIILP